jgi:AcrR family transcriptional regulator
VRQAIRSPRDRRVQKTRQALLDAFFTLVLKAPYEDITVRDIVVRAGVGRSTLYEHFSGKDAILAASLGGPFAVLADALQPRDNTAALTALLEHFWSNRAVAPGIFAGPMRRRTVAVLVRLIEQRLRAEAPARRTALLLPTRLAAIHLAEALFAPVAAWLAGQSACSAQRLALALRKAALALTEALRGEPPAPRRFAAQGLPATTVKC